MQRPKLYRLNQQILAVEVRLIDSHGKQIGVVPKDEALKRAQEENIDLVEIASQAKPPVCKLIDFKKFLYQEGKRKKEEKKKANRSETKEIRLGPFTGAHDLNVRIERAREFLKEGHKIKIVVKFTGRQMAHPEFGHKTMKLFLDALSGILKIEREPHFEGRLFLTLVSPIKGGNKVEAKNEKVDS